MIKTAAPTPTAVKNQRCQPEAEARNENAAPLLYAHDIEKAGDQGGVTQLVVAQDQHLGELVGDQQNKRQSQPGQHGPGGFGQAAFGHQANRRTSPLPKRLLMQRPQIVGCAASWPTSPG